MWKGGGGRVSIEVLVLLLRGEGQNRGSSKEQFDSLGGILGDGNECRFIYFPLSLLVGGSTAPLWVGVRVYE